MDPTPWKHPWDHLSRSGTKTATASFPKGAWLWTRGIPVCAGIYSSEGESPSCLVFTMQQPCRREPHCVPLVTLRRTGLTRTPWPSGLFWGGESAQELLPAHMTRQESCQLPFSCWSSSSLHKHPGTTPTPYLAAVGLTLLNAAVEYRNHSRAQQQSHT